MGNLNGKGDLAAFEIAFYSPAFLVAFYLLTRKSLASQLGFLYIVTLSILRLVGASTLLYIQTRDNYSVGLIETSAITSAVGTAPLLLSLCAFLERLYKGAAQTRSGDPRASGLKLPLSLVLHTVPVVGLVLAIIGGVDNAPGSTRANTGRSLQQAGALVFLVFLVVLAGLAAWILVRWAAHVVAAERKLLYACLAALPFLFVRVLYSVLVAFAHPGGMFYFLDVGLWVTVFMLFLMEALVILLFLTAGLLTPRSRPQPTARPEGQRRGKPVVEGV